MTPGRRDELLEELFEQATSPAQMDVETFREYDQAIKNTGWSASGTGRHYRLLLEKAGRGTSLRLLQEDDGGIMLMSQSMQTMRWTSDEVLTMRGKNAHRLLFAARNWEEWSDLRDDHAQALLLWEGVRKENERSLGEDLQRLEEEYSPFAMRLLRMATHTSTGGLMASRTELDEVLDAVPGKVLDAEVSKVLWDLGYKSEAAADTVPGRLHELKKMALLIKESNLDEGSMEIIRALSQDWSGTLPELLQAGRRL